MRALRGSRAAPDDRNAIPVRVIVLVSQRSTEHDFFVVHAQMGFVGNKGKDWYCMGWDGMGWDDIHSPRERPCPPGGCGSSYLSALHRILVRRYLVKNRICGCGLVKKWSRTSLTDSGGRDMSKLEWTTPTKTGRVVKTEIICIAHAGAFQKK